MTRMRGRGFICEIEGGGQMYVRRTREEGRRVRKE